MSAESFRDRLRRLRRENDSARAPAPDADKPRAWQRADREAEHDAEHASTEGDTTPDGSAAHDERTNRPGDGKATGDGHVADSADRSDHVGADDERDLVARSGPAADEAPRTRSSARNTADSPSPPDELADDRREPGRDVRDRLVRHADRIARTRPTGPADPDRSPRSSAGPDTSAAFGRELAPPTDEPTCSRTTGPPANLERHGFAHSTYHARTTTFSIEHRHGDWRLVEVAAADPRAFEVLTGDAALGSLDPQRAIYLDTETTGLHGGAGTYVFLVGLGYFDGDRFHVWQGFLRDPSGERALLAETAARIRAVPGVVSFFGKAFDRHRLEDKMRLHRIEPPFAERAHLDLYHPLRRLYRRAFDDTRLRTFESRLCGLERKNDLPGAFAPAAWFDFLAGRPHRLEAVFRHNQDDVLSLVSLAAHLGSTLRGTRGDGEPLGDHAGFRAEAIARSFASAGEPLQALDWAERAIATLEDPRSRHGRLLRLFRVELLRKTGTPLAAFAEAEALCADPDDDLAPIAWYELARLCEKPLGDLERAAGACRRAREELDRRYIGALHARWSLVCAQLAARLERRRVAADRERP